MGELKSIVRFTIHEGKLDEFKRLAKQCTDVVASKDTGTLQYETYFNDDESVAIMLERYRDSDALFEHLANLGDELVAAISATGEMTVDALDPSDELRARLAASPVRLFSRYDPT